MATPKPKYKKAGGVPLSTYRLNAAEEVILRRILDNDAFVRAIERITDHYVFWTQNKGLPVPDIRKTLEDVSRAAQDLYPKLLGLPSSAVAVLWRLRLDWSERSGVDLDTLAVFLAELRVGINRALVDLPKGKAGRDSLMLERHVAQMLGECFTHFKLPFVANTWPGAKECFAISVLNLVFSAGGKNLSSTRLAQYITTYGQSPAESGE